MREPVNKKTLDKAMDARELQKLRMPKEQGRKIWDIDTNLLNAGGWPWNVVALQLPGCNHFVGHFGWFGLGDPCCRC